MLDLVPVHEDDVSAVEGLSGVEERRIIAPNLAPGFGHGANVLGSQPAVADDEPLYPAQIPDGLAEQVDYAVSEAFSKHPYSWPGGRYPPPQALPPQWPTAPPTRGRQVPGTREKKSTLWEAYLAVLEGLTLSKRA